MADIVLVSRLLLFAVFIVAAAGKALDIAGTRQAAREFGLSASLVRMTAVGLPALELCIALSLLAQPSARVGALAAIVLLAAFAVAIARVIRRGEVVACHCFGELRSAPVGWGTLIRNGVFAAIGLVVLAAGPGRSLAGVSPAGLVTLATSVSTLGLSVVVWKLWTENRELRERHGMRERPDRGLPTGSPIPDLALADLAGEPVTLIDRVSNGRPTLLVQLGIGCGPCRGLIPELVRWRAVLADTLDIVLVSGGESEPNRAFAEEFELAELLVDTKWVFPAAFDVRPTPSAVLIDAHGKVAAPPALGALAIEALAWSGTSDPVLR